MTKKTNIAYWIFTGLLIAMMGIGAIPDILYDEAAKESFEQLELPIYLLPFIGCAKILGIIAILIPGYPRVKEWAYAGFTFDLTGACYANLASGNIGISFTFIIGFILIAGSYRLYHKKRKA